MQLDARRMAGSGQRTSFNNHRAALIPSIARRRAGQVQPEDDLVLVVEAEALAGGLELCAARVLNADLEASRPILIKLMIHAPPNAHGRRGRAPQEAGGAAGWVAARPEDRRAGTDVAVSVLPPPNRVAAFNSPMTFHSLSDPLPSQGNPPHPPCR